MGVAMALHSNISNIFKISNAYFPWLRKSFTLNIYKDLKLKKALYGLKQSPRAWYGRIDSFLSSMGFTKSKADPNLYLKVVEYEPIMLLLYVDDLILTGNEKQIMESKKKLAE